MPKDIRFGELVKRSGKPHVISLWTDPKQDRSFMKAVKENRVLTLIQEPASKRKDFGRIGFHRKPHASYLVFPKPLPKETAPRVVGIKYDLVDQTSVSDPVKLSAGPPGNRPPKPQRTRKRFHVIVRRTAILESSVTIESAATLNEAKRKALKSIADEPFDLTKAVTRHDVLGVNVG